MTFGMRSRLSVGLLASLLGLAPGIAAAADGGIYKCDRGNGLIEYGNGSPLPSGCKYVELSTAPVVTVPAPKGSPSSSSITRSPPRPDNFPRVDASAQKSRDDDRRRVLESELSVQETKLADLKREYNNGEPERQGNERNYQKYLDRTSQLKDDISHGEANVASLRRELSALQSSN